MATYAYLDACNKLFERGFLYSEGFGKSHIKDMGSPVLGNIQEGFQHFREWCDVLSEGEHIHLSACASFVQVSIHP